MEISYEMYSRPNIIKPDSEETNNENHSSFEIFENKKFPKNKNESEEKKEEKHDAFYSKEPSLTELYSKNDNFFFTKHALQHQQQSYTPYKYEMSELESQCSPFTNGSQHLLEIYPNNNATMYTHPTYLTHDFTENFKNTNSPSKLPFYPPQMHYDHYPSYPLYHFNNNQQFNNNNNNTNSFSSTFQNQQHNLFISQQHQQQPQQQHRYSRFNDILLPSFHHNISPSHAASPLDSRTYLRSHASMDTEEINTREVAQKIASELKRYSIPQAVFAQQVLMWFCSLCDFMCFLCAHTTLLEYNCSRCCVNLSFLLFLEVSHLTRHSVPFE